MFYFIHFLLEKDSIPRNRRTIGLTWNGRKEWNAVNDATWNFPPKQPPQKKTEEKSHFHKIFINIMICFWSFLLFKKKLKVLTTNVWKSKIPINIQICCFHFLQIMFFTSRTTIDVIEFPSQTYVTCSGMKEFLGFKWSQWSRQPFCRVAVPPCWNWNSLKFTRFSDGLYAPDVNTKRHNESKQ